MKFDFSIIGKEKGEALLNAIKNKTVSSRLTPIEIAFLQFPNDADKQRSFKQKIDDAILSGELRL